MSGWVSCYAGSVQPAAASAGVAFVAAFLLAHAPPSRFGTFEVVARCVAVSLAAVAAAPVCLIMPRFLVVFGAASWPSALRSAAHNIDVTLVMIVIPAACFSLLKTRLVLRTLPRTGWIAADLGLTVLVAIAAALAYRAVWQASTGLDPGGGVVDFFRDQRLRAGVLCLPLAASGWAWVSAAASRRVWLPSVGSALAAGLWGGLFAPL